MKDKGQPSKRLEIKDSPPPHITLDGVSDTSSQPKEDAEKE